MLYIYTHIYTCTAQIPFSIHTYGYIHTHTHTYMHVQLGFLLHDVLEDLDGAEEMYNEALALEPESIETLFNLARAKVRACICMYIMRACI